MSNRKWPPEPLDPNDAYFSSDWTHRAADQHNRLLRERAELLAALKEIVGGMTAEIGLKGVSTNFPLSYRAIARAEAPNE